ncbi:MAG: DUF1232 domain-containing protein [Acidimicrobiia bacterium]|nr:DUF1232 domain-containing protein [Acidimicrobiia bacterium]
MDGEVIEMPEPEPIEPTLAVIQHPLDTSDPVPVRTRAEILREAVLLVPNLAKLLFRLLRDHRVPRSRRLGMAAIGAYVASPVDLIPDYIPVVGGLDDLLLLAFAVDYLLEASPEEVIAEHWDGSEDGLELVRGMSGWGVELLPERFRRLVADGGRRR